MKEYWHVTGRFGAAKRGYALEVRSNIALTLIERFGGVAAKIDGESSDGRWKLALQEPSELVARCFAITDAFMEEAEKRGGIRAVDYENEAENKGVA